MEKVLIVGIATGYGRLLARRLMRDSQVVGVDRVPWPSKIPDVPFYRVDVRTRRFEEVLRKDRTDGKEEAVARGRADTASIQDAVSRQLEDHRRLRAKIGGKGDNGESGQENEKDPEHGGSPCW